MIDKLRWVLLLPAVMWKWSNCCCNTAQMFIIRINTGTALSNTRSKFPTYNIGDYQILHAYRKFLKIFMVGFLFSFFFCLQSESCNLGLNSILSHPLLCLVDVVCLFVFFFFFFFFFLFVCKNLTLLQNNEGKCFNCLSIDFMHTNKLNWQLVLLIFACQRFCCASWQGGSWNVARQTRR